MYPRPIASRYLTRQRRSQQQGFTLIELAVVVVIIGIFATLAVPQITRQMRDRRVAQAAQEVVNFYRQARLRAMGRGGAVNVRYVPSSSGQGTLTVRDAVIGTGTTAACGEMPSSRCNGTNWQTAGLTSRPVATFDVKNNSGRDDIYLHMFQPSDGNAASVGVDVCFTPMGRTFWREGGQDPTADLFSPLTTVLSAEVRRRVGSSSGATIGLVREVTMLPSGVARTATRVP